MGIKHSTVKGTGQKGYAIDWNDDHVIDSAVDFNQNEAQNLVIETRTDWPAGPVVGQIIYRTDSKQFFTWDGSDWVEYGMPTKEIFFPTVVGRDSPAGTWTYPKFYYIPINPNCSYAWTIVTSQIGNESAFSYNFYIPHDFNTLIDAKAVLIGTMTGNQTFEYYSTYAANGEPIDTHSEYTAGNVVAMTNNQIIEIDMSDVLTNLSAGDYVGLVISLMLPLPSNMATIGFRLRYI